jgi:hypothetical protein
MSESRGTGPVASFAVTSEGSEAWECGNQRLPLGTGAELLRNVNNDLATENVRVW